MLSVRARNAFTRKVLTQISLWVPRGLCLLCALLAAGCNSEPRGGDANPDGIGHFDGTIDPSHGTIILNSATITGTDGTPLELTLIGRNLRIDTVPTPTTVVEVVMDVSVRNKGAVGLYAPAEVGVFGLNQIEMPNADRTQCLRCAPVPPCGCSFWYSYLDLLGGDGVLAPGEESGARPWRFRMRRVAPFSFIAQARFGLEPNRPHIAGITFMDLNENGQKDPDEFPAGGVTLRIAGPGIEDLVVAVDDHGAWSLPVTDPGLYTILATPPPTFAPVHFTTPNPLQVVLTPGPGGTPDSYDEANFGIANDPLGIPPVILFEGDPARLKQDSYGLLHAGLSGTVLTLQVGFSGCSGDHPLALYQVGGFMESNPVQAQLILSHDSRGEMCDAYFTRMLSYDLRPIQEAYRKAYGQPGVVLLNLKLPGGETRQFTLRPS